MTVIEIIKEYLEKNNYDGLCCSDVPCGCGINNMAPCCDNIMDCQPAYLKKDANCKECENGMCENVGNDDQGVECYTIKKPEEQ